MDLIQSAYYSLSDDDEDDRKDPLTVGLPRQEPPLHPVTATIENNSQESNVTRDATRSITVTDNSDVLFVTTTSTTLANSEAFTQIQEKQDPVYDSEVESVVNISDSESLDSSEISDHDDEKIKAKKRQPPKAKGEMWLQDLPPIEDLHISVPHEQCEPIGFIKSIVDTLVVVEAYPLTPALDVDSVLFLAQGDVALGKVFDVFGPVKHPHYCVRFNSQDHIISRGVKIDELVYCAPKTKHSAYVLVAQLQKLKGTDASWKDDYETPRDEQDFSDDDAEKAAKNQREPGVRKVARTRRGRGGRHYPSNSNRFVPPRVAGFGPPSFYQCYAPAFGPPPPPAPSYSPQFYRQHYPYQLRYQVQPPPPPPPLPPLPPPSTYLP